MTFANALAAEPAPAIFFARLRPHRSLSQRGFRIVIGALAALSFAVGTLFFALGAWPVPGFLGLDVVAAFVAFRWSYRSSRAAEEIRLDRHRLTVRKITASGHATVAEFNPYWARLAVERHPALGIAALAITSHGRSFDIGAFLGPGEREQLAARLTAALAEARAVATP